MRKILGITLASLVLAGALASCSPYRVKKKAPTKSRVGFMDFKKDHCGCGGK